MKKFKRIYIEITNKCNLKCTFCPKSKRTLKSMSVNKFENVLKRIKGYSDYIYLHVKGEPLLHKDIEEILKKVKEYKFNVIITTNGTLLKEKKDILKNSSAIRQINISLHSIEQNQTIKISKQQYMEDVINSADEISKYTNCYISYRLWNLEDIQEIDKNKEIIEILGQKYEIENIKEKIKTKDFLKLQNNKYINLDTIYEWPEINKEIVSKTGSCYGLKEQIAILVDGTVVPCCLDQEGNIKLGNIFEDTIEEILKSEISQKIIEGFNQNKLYNPLCQRCGFRENKRR